MGQGFSEIFPPKSKWLPADMPDMTGKVAIVTGGNTGIGKVTIKYLLIKNCTVYLLCRSASKAEAAIAELQAETGKAPVYIPCDLADLPAIKVCAAEFLEREQRLDVLFNNAGCMTTPMDQLTKQGYDMQFGTNVLGTAYLTMLLLPLLQSTAKSQGSARIVTLSSNAQGGAPKGGIDFATLRDGPVRRKKLTPWDAYFQSKWADACFSKELARRYGKDGIVCTSLNPGIIRTELARHATFAAWVTYMLGFPADPLGAVTQLYAGTAPEAGSMNGQYLIPWARPGKARPDTEDPETGRALWEWVEEQVKDV
ncbi:NAD-P-binding protein [Calocera viscosa TUFC12733]|uniref:NAD-P-binding protein n=1 Tax=Calocera viscosa (strain TUFC12733) TaxID=1330018 RepID=A0A167IMK0_CALVF|nr:NAD-P-binding protein [Calocera viscosa TUFC12733]